MPQHQEVEKGRGDIGPQEVASKAESLPVGKLQAASCNLQSFRAWCYLVWFSWQRQARAHLMVWVALGLLAFLTFVVALNTQAGRWSMSYWRSPPRVGTSYSEWLRTVAETQHSLSWDPCSAAVRQAVSGSFDGVLNKSGFFVFSNWIVFSVFTTFLLPLWSLTFASEGLGREREAGNLIWVLTRPLSRPSIYLAKFVAVLPWALGLNLGGFGILCAAAGAPGWLAFRLYWPAIFWATLAFCSLFHLMGAWFRRPAVVGILYAFFLETVVNLLPGYLKRFSISYYTRCLMFDSAHDLGIRPERPLIYLPISGTVAWCVLAGLTVGLLAAGMFIFSRAEYLDLS